MLFRFVGVTFRGRFFYNFLHQSVPFPTILALTEPLRILRTTVLTEICRFHFCHTAKLLKIFKFYRISKGKTLFKTFPSLIALIEAASFFDEERGEKDIAESRFPAPEKFVSLYLPCILNSPNFAQT